MPTRYLKPLILPVLALSAWTSSVAMARLDMPPLVDEQQAVRKLRALPSAEVARTLSLGFTTVLADYYWIRAVQYFGSGWNQPLLYRDLHPLIDLVSELDPRWDYPLLFGGVALPQNLGREVWVNTAESTALLEKGIQRFPGRHEFFLFAAYNRSTFHNDYERATRYLMECAKLPTCPDYVPKLATRMAAEAGQFDAALNFAKALLAENKDPNFVEAMEERIKLLEIERELSLLDKALSEFEKRYGTLPAILQELATVGLVEEIPADPFGGIYFLDRKTGRATSSSINERLRTYKFKASPIE